MFFAGFLAVKTLTHSRLTVLHGKGLALALLTSLLPDMSAGAIPQTVGSTAGVVSGRVSDSSGAVVPGVHVALTGSSVMGIQTTTTNASGLYRFPSLPPGVYSLVFTLSGFATVEHKDVQIGIGFGSTVDPRRSIGSPLRLRPGSMARSSGACRVREAWGHCSPPRRPFR
jgi:hypothetical protein